MNRKELVRDLAKKFELPVGKTNEIVTALLESITKSLTKGNTITFVGFGSFSTKKRAARTGRNPQTGYKNLCSSNSTLQRWESSQRHSK